MEYFRQMWEFRAHLRQTITLSQYQLFSSPEGTCCSEPFGIKLKAQALKKLSISLLFLKRHKIFEKDIVHLSAFLEYQSLRKSYKASKKFHGHASRACASSSICNVRREEKWKWCKNKYSRSTHFSQGP